MAILARPLSKSSLGECYGCGRLEGPATRCCLILCVKCTTTVNEAVVCDTTAAMYVDISDRNMYKKDGCSAGVVVVVMDGVVVVMVMWSWRGGGRSCASCDVMACRVVVVVRTHRRVVVVVVISDGWSSWRSVCNECDGVWSWSW